MEFLPKGHSSQIITGIDSYISLKERGVVRLPFLFLFMNWPANIEIERGAETLVRRYHLIEPLPPHYYRKHFRHLICLQGEAYVVLDGVHLKFRRADALRLGKGSVVQIQPLDKIEILEVLICEPNRQLSVEQDLHWEGSC